MTNIKRFMFHILNLSGNNYLLGALILHLQDTELDKSLKENNEFLFKNHDLRPVSSK